MSGAIFISCRRTDFGVRYHIFSRVIFVFLHKNLDTQNPLDTEDGFILSSLALWVVPYYFYIYCIDMLKQPVLPTAGLWRCLN